MERFELCRHFLELGIGVLIQSTCLIVLGLIAGRLLRRRGPFFELAAYRATLACVVVSALMAASMAGRVQPLWSVSIAAPPPAAVMSTALPNIAKASPRIRRRSHVGVAAPVSPLAEIGAPSSPSKLPGLYAALTAVWLLGVAVHLLWLFVCGITLRRFMARGERVTSGPVALLLAEIAERTGAQTPNLILHPDVRSPFLAGALRPTVVMPDDAVERYGEAGARAVLAHELSHFLQRDCAWNLGFRLAAALLWPQALLLALHRRWQEAAEYACDQWVLAHACPPRSYADCLLSIAENRSVSRSQRVLAIGVTPFRSMIGKRLARIVDWSGGQLRMLSRAGRIMVGGVAFVAAGGVLFLVSANAGARPAAKTAHRLIASAHIVRTEKPLSGGPVMLKKHTAMSALIALASGAVHVSLPAAAAPIPAKPAAPIKLISASVAPTIAAIPHSSPAVTRPASTIPARNAVTATPEVALVQPAPANPDAAATSSSPSAVSLNFTDAPVKDVLKQLFTQTGLNYVIGPEVTGTITVRLSSVSPEDALRTILKTSRPALSYELASGIYHIRLKDSEASMAQLQTVEEAVAQQQRRHYKLPIDYCDASELLKSLVSAEANGQGVAPAYYARVSAAPNENALLADTTPMEYEKLRDAVRILDVEPSRCQVHVQIVEASRDALARLGIDPQTLTNAKEDSPDLKGQALLDAVQHGKLPTLASPTVVTVSGVSAVVTVKRAASSIAMTATPSVRPNNDIHLTLSLEITNGDQSQSLKLSNLLFDSAPTFCGTIPDPAHPDRSLLVFATAASVLTKRSGILGTP
ncbi:hypothetical protein CCAX7_17900 [Capsulimonas corticalis]|uniref:Uncharacterized protein n=1 Tax=Capsulimonas corticalis TaxID=2219043 RepID=A0A402D3U8_9BACT|nr:M56 family metallopeptidase [Capsulimonas corticalis]BDI29739.1 hypothetical protein CCAX7_17900 [Capsulimonas corticalis]